MTTESTGMTVARQSASALVPTNIGEAMQLADIMAKANLIPEHLRGKPGDCLLIVMQAQRWGMDVVSVAQCTSVVHGKLCYEGKLVAAALYAMGAIDGRLHYEITGKGQQASIVVTATPRGGRGPQTVRGSVTDWRTYGKDRNGNRIDNAWDKMPEDMLVYRGTRQWARLYAPEALLGVYTPDEIDGEVIEGTIVDPPRTQRDPYPAADFERNFPTWEKAVGRGMRTAADILALIETRGEPTEEQRKRILALKVTAEPSQPAAQEGAE